MIPRSFVESAFRAVLQEIAPDVFARAGAAWLQQQLGSYLRGAVEFDVVLDRVVRHIGLSSRVAGEARQRIRPDQTVDSAVQALSGLPGDSEGRERT